MARHSEGFWNVAQTAAYLRCSQRTVRRYVNDGDMPHVRIAGRLLFIKADVDAWVAAQVKNAPESDRRSA